MIWECLNFKSIFITLRNFNILFVNSIKERMIDLKNEYIFGVQFRDWLLWNLLILTDKFPSIGIKNHKLSFVICYHQHMWVKFPVEENIQKNWRNKWKCWSSFRLKLKKKKVHGSHPSFYFKVLNISYWKFSKN